MNTSRPTELLTERASHLRAAFSATPIDESLIRDAVCSFVDAARLQGWVVERVLVEVKRMAEIETGSLHDALRDPARRASAQSIVNRAISVCIQHYYATTSP